MGERKRINNVIMLRRSLRLGGCGAAMSPAIKNIQQLVCGLFFWFGDGDEGGGVFVLGFLFEVEFLYFLVA